MHLALFSQYLLQIDKHNTVRESRNVHEGVKTTHTSLFFHQSMLSLPEGSGL